MREGEGFFERAEGGGLNNEITVSVRIKAHPTV